MAKRDKRLKRANTESTYTQEQLRELLRCTRDPVYFINNYVKVKHPVRGLIPFKLRYYQEDLIRKFQKHQYNIVLSARQTGKTETVGAYLLWFAIFNDTKTILVAANNGTNAMETVARIQTAYLELPEWLKPGIDEANWNKHNCGFDNGSRIISLATTENSGRGLPVSLLYCDEFAFVRPSIQQPFWDSISPTLATGGSCIISSTPNGDADLYSSLYRGAVAKSNEFVATHVPWDAAPGRDEAFKQKQIGLIGIRKWEQEYECSFLSSDHNLMDGVVMANIEKAAQNFHEQTEPSGDTYEKIIVDEDMEMMRPIKSGRTYLVALDPATGSGLDSSGFQVFEFPSMEHVMEYTNNTIKAAYVYRKLKTLIKYIEGKGGTVYWSLENNSVGQGIIALYEVDETPISAHVISQPEKDIIGFTTQKESKLKAALKLKELIEAGKLKIRGLNTIKELKAYVRKDGSYGGMGTSNDDLVASLLVMVRMLIVISDFDADAFGMMYTYHDGNMNYYWDRSQSNEVDPVNDSASYEYDLLPIIA